MASSSAVPQAEFRPRPALFSKQLPMASSNLWSAYIQIAWYLMPPLMSSAAAASFMTEGPAAAAPVMKPSA